MVEKECNENMYPFFAMQANSRKFEVFLPKDDTGTYSPFGCMSFKNGNDVWSDRVRVNIQEWTKHFVKALGYGGDLKREEIVTNVNPDGKSIQFDGSFGHLEIDAKANMKYESFLDQEPTSL